MSAESRLALIAKTAGMDVKVDRSIGKARLYKVDKANPMIKTITEFERRLSMQIAEQEEQKIKYPVVTTG